MSTNPELGRYLLNCFSVEFSVHSVTVAVIPWTEETDMGELRKGLGNDWFVLRRGDKIYGLATVPKPAVEFGQATTVLPLSGYDGLDFMRARLNEALPELLPKYEAERVRPFQFLARKDEFVSNFAAKRQLPDVVKNGFAIRPRFALEARTIELIEEDLRVAVAMSVAMQWEVSASLVDLANLGVQLDGLYVVLKYPQPGERRLVGRIKSVSQGNVDLDETMDGRTSIAAELVRLEGSKFTFKRCLSKLLGQRYRDFEAEREAWEATYTSGPSFDSVLEKLSSSLKPVNLGSGIVATIGAAITIENTEGAPIYRELPPVEYCFDAAKTKRKAIPWDGLVEFGPYDGDTFQKRTPRTNENACS